MTVYISMFPPAPPYYCRSKTDVVENSDNTELEIKFGNNMTVCECGGGGGGGECECSDLPSTMYWARDEPVPPPQSIPWPIGAFYYDTEWRRKAFPTDTGIVPGEGLTISCQDGGQQLAIFQNTGIPNEYQQDEDCECRPFSGMIFYPGFPAASQLVSETLCSTNLLGSGQLCLGCAKKASGPWVRIEIEIGGQIYTKHSLLKYSSPNNDFWSIGVWVLRNFIPFMGWPVSGGNFGYWGSFGVVCELGGDNPIRDTNIRPGITVTSYRFGDGATFQNVWRTMAGQAETTWDPCSSAPHTEIITLKRDPFGQQIPNVPNLIDVTIRIFSECP